MAWWILAGVLPVGGVLLVWEVRRTAARRRVEEDLAAAAVVSAERVKVAQELHDLVAHAVSVMTFGVGAGRMIMDRDPDKARETLRVAEACGRQALGDLQRLLALLATLSGSPATRAPQPSLADLETLLGAEPAHDGTPVAVGAALELAVYRIVEECLACTGPEATVTLRWRAGHLDVRVRHDGAPSEPSGPCVLRLRARAAAFGGTFTVDRTVSAAGSATGSATGSALELRARLPL